MLKRNKIFIVLAAGVLLVLLFVFFQGFRSGGFSLPSKGAASLSGSLVSRFNGKVRDLPAGGELLKLTDDETSFPVLGSGGKEIFYYAAKTGEIKSLPISSLAGSSNLISSKVVAKIGSGAKDLLWSSDRNSIIAALDSGILLFDLKTGQSKKYDSKISSAVFSPNEDKISYLFFDRESASGQISIADSRLESFRNIMPTRLDSWLVKWSSKNLISLLKPVRQLAGGPTQASLFTLTLEGRLEKIASSPENLDYLISPDGSKIIYSAADKPSLVFEDLRERRPKTVSISAKTDSCVWSFDNKTVYCSIFAQSIGASDTATATDGGLAVIDTSPDLPGQTSLSARVLFEPSKAGPAPRGNLILTPLENFLVFRNLNSGKLYALPISF